LTVEANPYSADPYGTDVLEACVHACAALEPFLYEVAYADIGSSEVYCINEPGSEAANVCRAIEGFVFERDWGLPPAHTVVDFAPFEGNSIFFLLTTRVDGQSRPVGVLRVADLSVGPSESESAYRELIGDGPLPAELRWLPEDRGVWDVVGVAVLPEYRNGLESAWLYHALYQASLDRRITRWITNVTPRELRNLREWMGIPFTDVGESGIYVGPTDGVATEFIFCECLVGVIAAAVSQRIAELERDESEMSLLISQAASVALTGRFPPLQQLMG